MLIIQIISNSVIIYLLYKSLSEKNREEISQKIQTAFPPAVKVMEWETPKSAEQEAEETALKKIGR